MDRQMLFRSGIMLLEIKLLKINSVDRRRGKLLRLWVLMVISCKFRLLQTCQNAFRRNQCLTAIAKF